MEYEFHKIFSKNLIELLADEFFDCIIEYNNKDWKPRWVNANKNFLHFPNNDKIGTTAFMKSVALRKKIFFDEGNGYSFSSPHREKEFNELNINNDLKILQFTEITDTTRKTVEKILKDSFKSLPDSITIISESKFGKKPFPGGQKSSDWGNPTPKNQTASKTKVKNEEKRYTYYKTLARSEQSNFRKILLEEYNNACIITRCTTQTALEAAHIKPFADGGADTLENGLLLRADLHLLFDAYLMAIDPKTSEVHFKETDKNYNKYTHAKIPDNDKLRENLKIHWHKFQTT